MASIPNVSLLIGPLELGAIACSFLVGCLVIQTFVYYSQFSSDSKYIKVFVAGLCIAELLHFVCEVVVLWQSTITAPVASYYALYTVVAATLAISFGAELFYIVRLVTLSASGSKFLPLVCLVLSLVFATTGTVVVIDSFAITNLLEGVDSHFLVIMLSLISGAVCDLTITASLIYYLLKMRNTNFRSTSRMVDTLIRWSIETGLTPTLCSILTVICFARMRDNFVWLGVYAVLASVRANALLATLNGRLILNKRRDEEALEFSSIIREQHPTESPIVVNITRSSELKADNDNKDQVQEN
ncbi:hypothetical protein BJ138DRAFT_1114764 [Hygrophoropsis aurantiaca]|uniref:Uncharacterized protein n=1 Tax=Hygrophoropsis aurantiaca TaxID=72124 RepID=A0ACB8A874_9AGAM|nr:hypothetical protein BJ138DRAFT_1114764 [Hygrophoropsis aurantiaca]